MKRLAVCTTATFTLLMPAHSCAQEVPLQRVEVAGKVDARRDDTAARIVVGREQIAQYGDTSLSAVLKRQPGVAVSGNEIRLRGLGAGYTQILINGDPAPPGFSIDSIAPAMIERIDILRSGSAELGAQAIAGTINIILRKAGGKPQRELKAGAGSPGRPDPALILNWSDKAGDLAYALGAEMAHTGTDNVYMSQEFGTERGTGVGIEGDTGVGMGGGTGVGIVSRRATRETTALRNTRVNLAPRLTWKTEGGTLAWQALGEFTRAANQGGAAETLLAGRPTTYPVSGFKADVDSWSARTDLTWTREAGEGKLTVKGAASRYARDSDYVFRGAGGSANLVRQVISDVYDDSASLSGKYLAPLTSAHSIALGWDGGINRRSESRRQDDSTFAALFLARLDEEYRADVMRLALFAQDEWRITPRLQAYLGMRWEGLHSATRGSTLDQVSSRSSVASPTAQLLWKLPDSDQDQLRLALARSYKAPLVRNLVPRRYTINNGNSPTNPDVRGNPALRPELAWGLDLAYERYMGKDAMASVSAYARRIDQVTVQSLYRENGAWMSTPFNHGRARVAGIEFDGKISRGKVDWRANGARHWSRIDAVPGPDNRLEAQARITANLGADLRWSGAVSVGANLNLQFAGAARLSPALRSDTGPVRTLDAYGLWKINAGMRVRLTATNALHPDRVSGRAFDDGVTATAGTTRTAGPAVVRVLVEWNL